MCAATPLCAATFAVGGRTCGVGGAGTTIAVCGACFVGAAGLVQAAVAADSSLWVWAVGGVGVNAAGDSGTAGVGAVSGGGGVRCGVGLGVGR